MKQRALLDLDMILDTRYGVLSLMNPEAAIKLAASSEYRMRDTDDFEKISNGVFSNEEYKKIYDSASTDIILHSKMSDFVFFQRMDILEYLPKMVRGIESTEIELHINFWRYDLHPSDKELIKRSFERYMPTLAKVCAVDIDPKDLTPEVISKSYEMIAFYNHEDWLKHHLDNLIKFPILEHVLLTPRIATSGIVPEPSDEFGDSFLCRSAVFVRHIALHFIPTFHVCWNPVVFANIAKRAVNRPDS